MYYTQTKFDYDIIFWAIGISRDNDVTIVSALIELQPLSAFSSAMLNATYTLGACLLLCKVSQKLTHKRNFEKF